MKKWLQQVELKGELVTLIPLTRAHENALIKAAADGCYRDTVVFSIINHEWKTVKKSLKFLLEY